MRKRTICGLLLCVTLVFCFSLAPSAIASDEEEILEVVENLAKALSTLDCELNSTVWLNSSDTSRFAPFKIGAFLTKGADEILGAFKSMSEEVPAGMLSLSTYNKQVTILEKDVAIVTGYGIFTVTPPNTNEQFVTLLRGSNVLQKVKGKWQIVHGHWSQLPTE